jgi:hypothetical protein
VTTDVFSKNHTFLLTDLKPSTNHSAPNGEYSAQTTTYNVRIDVTARNGNTTSTQMTVTPQGHKESTNFDINEGPQQRLLLNHVVSALSMTPITTPAGNPGRSVTITTSYKRGGSFIGNVFRRPRAADRVIIARIFAHDTHTLAMRPLDDTEIAAVPGKSFLVDDAYLMSSTPPPNTKLLVGLQPGTNKKGILLVSENPTVTVFGTTTMDFGLLQPLGANEKVVFSIEAVVHVDPLFNTWTGSTMVTGTPPNSQLVLPTMTVFPVGQGVEFTAWSKWSFPDTKEAGAQVRDP